MWNPFQDIIGWQSVIFFIVSVLIVLWILERKMRGNLLVICLVLAWLTCGYIGSVRTKSYFQEHHSWNYDNEIMARSMIFFGPMNWIGAELFLWQKSVENINLTEQDSWF